MINIVVVVLILKIEKLIILFVKYIMFFILSHTKIVKYIYYYKIF